MAGIDATPETVGGATPRRRRNSTSSKQSGRSARSGRSEASGASAVGGLPQHVQTNEDAQSFAELQKAQKLFKAILAVDESQWTVAHDHKQSKIWMKKREGDLLPVVKGEALIEGVTTEQALGTILSGAARKECELPCGVRRSCELIVLSLTQGILASKASRTSTSTMRSTRASLSSRTRPSSPLSGASLLPLSLALANVFFSDLVTTSSLAESTATTRRPTTARSSSSRAPSKPTSPLPATRPKGRWTSQAG